MDKMKRSAATLRERTARLFGRRSASSDPIHRGTRSDDTPFQSTTRLSERMIRVLGPETASSEAIHLASSGREHGSGMLTPSEPAPPPTEPESSSDDIARREAASLPVAVKRTQCLVDELRDAVDHGDHFLVSLKMMLAGLVTVIDIVKREGSLQSELNAIKMRLKAIETIASASTTSDGAQHDNLQNHTRATTEIVQKILNVVVPSTTGTHGRPTVEQIDEIRDLLEVLEAFLEIYQVDDKVAVNDRLAAVHQALEKGPYALHVRNSNSNTTYNFGHDVVNNNWVKVFVFSGGTDYMTPNLARKQDDIIRLVKLALGSRFVHEAAHDTQPEDAGCLLGTRGSILQKFMQWAKTDAMKIYWLSGQAGAGKTSIAVTLCRMLHADEDVIFGGAFFCSRTASVNERTDARCIFPTLAGLLAEQSPGFAALLAKELNSDSRAATKPVAIQIEPLLGRPLAALSSSPRPIVFVIDALDECSDENEVESLLQAVTSLTCAAIVKFILTSRPETHINRSPISNSDRSSILRLHTIDIADVTADIERYIHSAFSRQPLSNAWYSESDVSELAARAEGLFIFASTIVKYLLDGPTPNARRKRLQNVLLAVDTAAATAPLDAMYEFVLIQASLTTKVDPGELSTTRQVLACILISRMPLSVGGLADLIGHDADDLRGSLERLQAVVHVPEQLQQRGLRTLHATFGDYLLLRATDGIRITASYGHEILARACLKTMSERLCMNISQFRSSYKPNPENACTAIAFPVEYSCLQWIFHVSLLEDPTALDRAVEEVFQPKFLFWLEVMSALGRVRRATAMLVFAAALVRSKDPSRFLRDCISFVTSSREAIERCAPHIYLSALPLAARDSLVYATFAPLCTGTVTVTIAGLNQHGGRHVMTLTGHEDAINSVAYSCDGLLVASGSRDGTVRVWDMRTGDEAMSPLCSGDGPVLAATFSPKDRVIASGTDSGAVCVWILLSSQAALRRLSGHYGAVSSLAFSPAGSILASASVDMTVRLWNLEEYQQLAVLGGHIDWVNAVSFFPDGQTLASGSDDEKIRFWHSSTGKPADEPLCDHFFPCSSLSISPDSTKIVSGSQHCARLWDLQTGKFLTDLDVHKGDVRSVQFSPDGQFVMTAVDDGSVYLWNILSESTTAVVLGGHLAGVCCATFSPDGLYVASASEDMTIRIWNSGSGLPAAAQSWQTYESGIRSVSTSPDSKTVVSGYEDGSLRAWDIGTGEPILPPLLGHGHAVTSVAISSDGRTIASASLDNTVRLWKIRKGLGAAIGAPLSGHADGVRAVTFSPCGKWLVSGSQDEAVHVWDVQRARLSPWGPLHCGREVNTVAYSPDGGLIAAGDSGGRVHLWKAEIGTLLQTFAPQAKARSIYCVTFSQDGAHLAAGGLDNRCTVWNIARGQQVFIIEGHTDRLNSVMYSPDGRFIVTGSHDRTVRLWSAEKGAPVATLKGHTSIVRSAVFTPDGRSIVSGSRDCTIRVWNVEAASSSLPDDAACWLLPGNRDGTSAPVQATLEGEWLVGPSNELLLWMPAGYQPHLPEAPCTLRIGSPLVSVSANDEICHFGETWTQCWRT